ncbi:MAG: 3-dehydroquinate synthase [Clostridiales bacterium]|jgi:3-dehydroquinate synthase|nr:3-dehydroquinate synthase [Clostridiales bacterium]
MNPLNVKAGQLSYPIYFCDSYSNLQNAVKSAGLSLNRCVIITDSNVSSIYLAQVTKTLKSIFTDVFSISFPAGEESKNLDTVKDFYAFFTEKMLDRKSVIFALGGGVTGDMAGFAAATFMRGIPYVQLPTSLLAQVDSSVGGKVGVDFMGNKNFVGAFYQPRLVYINYTALLTLPYEQILSGMGEVIKHGLIQNEDYYRFIIKNVNQIIKKDTAVLREIIKGSCEIKSFVVERDERELGLREILNFGHTFGHAFESLSNFTELHGIAVATGVRAALYLSCKMGNIEYEVLSEYENLLKQLNYKPLNLDVSADAIYKQMLADKKTKNGRLNFVLLKNTGNAYTEIEVPKDMVMEAILYMNKSF